VRAVAHGLLFGVATAAQRHQKFSINQNDVWAILDRLDYDLRHGSVEDEGPPSDKATVMLRRLLVARPFTVDSCTSDIAAIERPR